MTDDLVGPFPDGVDRDAYDRARRRVLWSFPTGLFVVGSTGVLDDGRPVAMAGEQVRTATTGAPILAGALAWVDCRLHSADELGSHTLFVGEVVDVGGPPGDDAAPVLRMEDTRMSYGG